MSIRAAQLESNVSVTGGSAARSELRGVGTEVSAAQAALGRFGSAGGIASKGLGLVERGAGGAGAALTHLKGTMGGLLTGPLGFLGLGAGVLGLGGALKSGIDTASNMALAIEKLTALTGESAQAMSGLMAVMGKYGVSSDQLSTIVGFEEKTTGKLAETYGKTAKAGKSAALQSLENQKAKLQETGASTKLVDKLITEQKARDQLTASTSGQLPALNKLQALQKQYGVTLTDSSGKALDFSTVLNHVSDYYNSNATQGQKAALAATLFGRGYAALIPVLQLGSKGFAEAQQAAESLGLTLNDQNAKDLKNYQETMRNLGDAVGGLQLQLSLALVPALEDVATAATKFIGDNRAGIVAFFKTLIADARTAAGFLTGTVIPDLQALAGAAVGFWNAIPPELRDILVKGFIAGRAMKFLFGFDPVTAIGSIIGKQLLSTLAGGIGGILGKVGGSVLGTAATDVLGMRVFVTNMPPGGFGGGGNPIATAGEDAAAGGAGAGGILAGVTAAQAAVSVAAVAAAAVLIVNANQGRKDLADKASKGDPVAIRTQNELATRGMGGGGTANLTGGASGSMGMATLPKAIAAAFAPDQQAVIGRLAASEHADAMAGSAMIAAAVAQAAAHGAAIAAITKVDGSIHNLLTSFRSGDAKVAINDFPRELAYMATASDAQKKTAVYASGLRQDISALQHAEVGATGAQKAALQADIRKLQSLQAASAQAAAQHTLLTQIRDKAIAQLTKLQQIKDKDSSVTVNLTTSISGDPVSKTTIRLKSGVRVT